MITRYEAEWETEQHVRAHDGDYVLYDDVKPLLDELERLRKLMLVDVVPLPRSLDSWPCDLRLIEATLEELERDILR